MIATQPGEAAAAAGSRAAYEVKMLDNWQQTLI